MTHVRGYHWLLGAIGLGACVNPNESSVGASSHGATESPPSTAGTNRATEGDDDLGTSASSSTTAESLDDTTSPRPASSSSGPGDSTGACPLGTVGCPCDDGLCQPHGVCLADLCEPNRCPEDVLEPNEGEADSVFLGKIDDDDDHRGMVFGSLHYPGDVDWFHYQGADEIGNSVDPARELVASAGVRLCKFLECDNGIDHTEFECPPATEFALSPLARPGCCASNGFELRDLNCTGTINDSASVYLRIDQPTEACTTYTLTYHY